MDKDMFYWF